MQLWQSITDQKAKHYREKLLSDQQITANQEHYDVTYYDLNLILEPSTEFIYGNVEVAGVVVTTGLDLVQLNFCDDMFLTDVRMSASPEVQLNFYRNNDLLTVYLDRHYAPGEQFRFTVAYNGRPQDSEQYGWAFGFDTHEGQPMIWSFSQPWGARGWWPCKDVPSDKADSVDIRVTVPNGLIVASNGALKQTTTQGNTTTFWWHEKYPIATYLVSIAVYPYDVHYDDYVYNDGTDTMKIHFYTFPRNYNKYRSINGKVKEMIGYFSELFGDYPFIDEKYGHADFSVGGAIEHQTCTSFHFWNEWVYAHELAHQWWGDMVTYDSWQHTWLGEGFATYSEALWYEHLYGPGAASEYQMQRNAYLGRGTVYVKDPVNFTSLIDNPFYPGTVYQRGSWVLHMLRHIVGDTDFFEILKSFNASPEHGYGTATTEDFQAICEQVTGRDLGQFFHQWIYEEYFPRYDFSWNWVQNGSWYDIQLEINQKQENVVFWMPIDVTIETVDGDTTLVVLDSLKNQSFRFSVESEPVDLELDKYNWILKTVQEPVSDPSFDQGVLLVNGVLFEAYGFEIWDAYERKAFWGDLSISFWDCLNPSETLYPSTLPEPLGNGRVPDEILGQYSTVIWVGNNWRGDLVAWQQTSIRSYLDAGGNVVLLTRLGRDFLQYGWEEYLGFSWIDSLDHRINDCVASYPGLVDMEFLSDQTVISVFDANLSSSESTLLFQETSTFETTGGLGLWHKSESGGGHFVFISGRPYRYDWYQLSSNIGFIVETLFQESDPSGVDIAKGNILDEFVLEQNYPNPFNASTVISFQIPIQDKITLTIFNLMGQEVRRLFHEESNTGQYRVVWDGRDNHGLDVPSAVYVCVLTGGECNIKKKMTLLR